MGSARQQEGKHIKAAREAAWTIFRGLVPDAPEAGKFSDAKFESPCHGLVRVELTVASTQWGVRSSTPTPAHTLEFQLFDNRGVDSESGWTLAPPVIVTPEGEGPRQEILLAPPEAEDDDEPKLDLDLPGELGMPLLAEPPEGCVIVFNDSSGVRIRTFADIASGPPLAKHIEVLDFVGLKEYRLAQLTASAHVVLIAAKKDYQEKGFDLRHAAMERISSAE